MPALDRYGAQPPIELIRQWLNHGYWSDLKDASKIELVDLLLVSAMGSLGGSNYIFPRFYRHAFVVAIDSFDDSTLNLIFTSINDWHFSKGYVDKVTNLSRVCTISFIVISNIIRISAGSQCCVR